jgi:hypothetical protein
MTIPKAIWLNLAVWFGWDNRGDNKRVGAAMFSYPNGLGDSSGRRLLIVCAVMATERTCPPSHIHGIRIGYSTI